MSYDIQILNIPPVVPPVSEIEYQIDSGSIVPIAALIDDYPVGFLPPGTYANRIRGKNAIGVGPWSANKNKTIDWDDIFTYYSLGQGYVYDMSRVDTMWQDHLQTTPVTDYGQPVGYQLDLSGNGNHRSQSDVAKRGIYGRHPASGIRNLLIATATLATQSVTVTAAQHTLSFRGTGTVTLSGASTAGPLVGTGASDIVSLTFTPSAGSLTLTVSGTVEIAQLELGPIRTTYQAVGATRWDISEVGSPDCFFLAYDGINDGMQTIGAVNATSNDELTIIAAVRKLRDSTTGRITESSANLALNNGAFNLDGPHSNNQASFGTQSKGTTVVATNGAGFPAPASAVLTSEAKISTPFVRLRRNTIQTQNTNSQGTGNYGNHVVYFGNRGGASLFFMGNEYFHFVCFTNLPSSLRNAIEIFARDKAGVSW